MRQYSSKWKATLPLAIALVALLSAGCSGSSSGGMMPAPPMGNTPPVASITANPTSVPPGDNHMTIVTIDGFGSTDADGDPLSFAWTVHNGTFRNGTTSSDPVIEVSFPGVAPYTVTLVVGDGHGGSDSASTVIDLR